MGRYLKTVKGYPSQPKTVGEHIKKRRLDLGLKQTEVAARLGMHFTSLQLWERGIGDPGVKPLPEIIRFLGYVPFECEATPGGGISFVRRCCGKTQEELAEMISCNPDTIGRWESNRSNFSQKYDFAMDVLQQELESLGIRDFVSAALPRLPSWPVTEPNRDCR
jgi:transcriptional regulator with XRE-family HTH domain